MTSKDVLKGEAFEIKTEIKPEELDWENSRPVKPWRVRRGAFEPPGPWDLEWIELCRSDVTKAFGLAGGEGGPAERATKKSPSSKKRPASERATRALDELYPKACPTTLLYRTRHCA